jgi:hydrogenase maturation protease
MTNGQILVAGIGNIFFGDDGFGVEVARQLQQEHLPQEVLVIDYGIRSYDLAYAMMADYEAVILVDATHRGESPGTIMLIEPDLSQLGKLDGEIVNAHSMNPVRVLHLVQNLGGELGKIYVVGCEPAVLETENGYIGLSDVVDAAIPTAINVIQRLIRDILVSKISVELTI